MFEHLLGIFFSNRIILLLLYTVKFHSFFILSRQLPVAICIKSRAFGIFPKYLLRKVKKVKKVKLSMYRTWIYICAYYIYINKHMNHMSEPHCKRTGEWPQMCIQSCSRYIIFMFDVPPSSMITCTMHFLLCKPSRVDPSNFLQTTGHSTFLHMHQRILPAVYII